MLSTILTAALAIGALGLLFGLILAFASKVFYVKVDPKIEQIISVLPGANCGACGFPGCGGYADAIVTKDTDFTMCAPGGTEAIHQIGEILGKSASDKERHIAIIHCNSGGYSNTNLRYDYQGIASCKAATLLVGGPNKCTYGCVSQNDCVRACSFGGITIDENGMRQINRDMCYGCGACVKACPRHLIKLVPISKKVYILCCSKDKGATAKTNCGANTPCIGCGICTKTCPTAAIKVENNLATIDYALCINCGLCATKCPTKAIVDENTERGKAYIKAEDCIGCTICAKKCPLSAITGELKKPHIVDKDKCVGCEVCVSKCPKRAIVMVEVT